MKTQPFALPSGSANLWWTLGVIALAVALTTLSLYFALHQDETTAARPVPPHGEGMAGGTGAKGEPPQIQAMVERLAARLEQEPNNGPGWRMLARSYATLGRFADSARAHAHAVALLPPDASLLADYADAVAMTQSGSFQGEPARLIRKALEIDPYQPKALALAGTEAFKRNDITAALGYWNKALAFVPADSELGVSIRGGIADAEKRRNTDG